MLNAAEFWERKWVEGPDNWIRERSGEDIKRVLASHGLSAVLCLEKSLNIVEIGPGRGAFSRAFAEAGHTVFAFDVNENAIRNLDGVQGILAFNSTAMLDMPSVQADIVFCHNVFQHCSVSEVIWLMKGARYHLKEGGVFNFQTMEPGENDTDTGGVFRYPRKVEAYKKCLASVGFSENGTFVVGPHKREHRHWYYFRVLKTTADTQTTPDSGDKPASPGASRGDAPSPSPTDENAAS